MISKLLVMVMLCSCLMLATSTSIDIDMILAQHQQSLQALWQTSNKHTLNMQTRNDDCFIWYINQQNVNMQTYRKNNAQCGQTADAAKKLLSEQGANTRAGLIYRGNGICKELASCEAVADLLEFYKCYYNTTSDNTGELYKLSTESNAEYNALSLKYKNIDAECDVCTANVRDQYIRESAETDEHFRSCEAGGWLPTTQQSTVSTTLDTMSRN